MSQARLNRLLAALAGVEGSDLHVKAGAVPRIRVDGALAEMAGEKPVTERETQAMATAILRPDLAKRFAAGADVDFAHMAAGIGRFRANAFRQRGTVALAFRLVRTASQSLDDLGLPDVVGELALQPRGLVLVTGPTGSGKTTTLAAMIDHINANRACNIITVEDPIEVLHEDQMASVSQREIGVDATNFASAVRSALRQDPDVILVGEMRDEETVAAALSAAETGHLVLSTLHTIDAPETVNRIIDFFPPHQQHQARTTLASVIRGTVGQRLVPAADGSGRQPALEVMVATGRIAQCIIDPAETSSMTEMIAEGDYYGMMTFDQSLADLVESGAVDIDDALDAASKPHDLKVMLQQRGLGTQPVAVAG